MPRKKRRTKTKNNNDITGIVLISIGLFVLFSVFSPSSSGIIGTFIKKILIALFGIGAIIFPFIIIFNNQHLQKQ